MIDLIKSSYNRISTIIKDIEKNIKINGEIKNTDKNTLCDILLENGFSESTKAIAVALNKSVITKSQWQNQNVKENDEIEIVKPFQGG